MFTNYTIADYTLMEWLTYLNHSLTGFQLNLKLLPQLPIGRHIQHYIWQCHVAVTHLSLLSLSLTGLEFTLLMEATFHPEEGALHPIDMDISAVG